jgi:uncharacterized protein (DUF488 family)
MQPPRDPGDGPEPSPGTVYLTGYGKGWTPEALRQFCLERGIAAIDIRFSPNSRDSRWRREFLLRTLGTTYRHFGEFGNADYQSGGIRIANMRMGIRRLAYVMADRGVLLFCGCRDPANCHRTTVGEELRRHGYTVVEIDPPRASSSPSHPSLF